MVGRTTRPTASQRRRMDAISKMRCVACDVKGRRQPNATTVHHLVDLGNRRASGGHDATLPLCRWHHLGVPARGSTLVRTQMEYGASMALSKRAFVLQFGTERELLEVVNERLEAST